MNNLIWFTLDKDYMMTLNKLIKRLNKLKEKVGGDTPATIAFNGVTESGELLGITYCDTQRILLNGDEVEETNNPDLAKIKKIVVIFSNREKYCDTL
jgi:hypothetical protein